MCNAYNHPSSCDCGFGGDTGGGGAAAHILAPPRSYRPRAGWDQGQALVYLTLCWWCYRPAYFYRNPNGGCALFESPGWPWPLHPCWEEHRAQRSAAERHYRHEFERNRDRYARAVVGSERIRQPKDSRAVTISGVVTRQYPVAAAKRLRSAPNATGPVLVDIEISEFSRYVYLVSLPSPLARLLPEHTLCRVEGLWVKERDTWHILGCSISLPGARAEVLPGVRMNNWRCRYCHTDLGRDSDPVGKWGLDPDAFLECSACGRRRGSLSPSLFMQIVTRPRLTQDEARRRRREILDLRNSHPLGGKDLAGTYCALEGDFRPEIVLFPEGRWTARRAGGAGYWRASGAWFCERGVLRLFSDKGLWLSLERANDSPSLWLQVDDALCDRSVDSPLNHARVFEKTGGVNERDRWLIDLDRWLDRIWDELD